MVDWPSWCCRLAAYVHYYGLFFMGSLGSMHRCFAKKKALPFSWRLALPVVLLLYAPWIPTLIEDLQHTKT